MKKLTVMLSTFLLFSICKTAIVTRMLGSGYPVLWKLNSFFSPSVLQTWVDLWYEEIIEADFVL